MREHDQALRLCPTRGKEYDYTFMVIMQCHRLQIYLIIY